MMFKNGIMFWLLLGVISTGVAGVFFDPERNLMIVRDYPAELPCTLPGLARFDRHFGWNKVQYDAAADAYTIRCHLSIGSADDGSETYFQVGTAEKARETLIMHGNIYVQPYWTEAGGKHGRWWDAPARVNRFAVGSAANTNIRAVVKFAPENNLTTGRTIDGQAGRGGQFLVYNGRITALDPAKGFGMSRGALSQVGGDGTVLVNARIEHARGNLLYGMAPGWRKLFRVEKTVFSDFGFLAPGKGRYAECVFEGAEDAAIRDYGGIDLELVNCKFRDNARNWVLLYSDKGLTLIDCVWDSPRYGDQFRSRTMPDGTKIYPKLIVRRHVVVETVDAAGLPVQGATVTFRPEQEGCELIRSKFTTDMQGRTPGPGETNALLLTEYIKTATDENDQPSSTMFSYTLIAEKDRLRGETSGVRADEIWKTVAIRLGD